MADEKFLVTVNLLDCSTFTGRDKVFISMVDTSNFTLVFEFKKWMQWMFSLEECVQITHKDAVVHDLEDVKILALLKHVDLSPCPKNCFHSQQGHLKLLRQLNLLSKWETHSVTTHFMLKFNKISQTNTLKQKQIPDSPRVKSPSSQEVTNEAKFEDDKLVDMQTSPHPMNLQDKRRDFLHDASNDRGQVQRRNEPNAMIPQYKCQGKGPQGRKGFSNPHFVKVFTVSDVLQRCRDLQETPTQNADNDSSLNNEISEGADVEAGDSFEAPTRKRKRVRKHKSKMNQSVDNQFIGHSKIKEIERPVIPCDLESFNKPKYHVRFQDDSDEEKHNEGHNMGLNNGEQITTNDVQELLQQRANSLAYEVKSAVSTEDNASCIEPNEAVNGSSDENKLQHLTQLKQTYASAILYQRKPMP